MVDIIREEVITAKCIDMQGNEYELAHEDRVRNIPKHISVMLEFPTLGKHMLDEWRDRELTAQHSDKIWLSFERRRFKITDIQEPDKNTRIISLKRLYKRKQKPKQATDDEEYKKMLFSTNLQKDKLLQVLEEMLTNCFTPKELNYLMKNTPEFIMDEGWMYIKSGKIAFRV